MLAQFSYTPTQIVETLFWVLVSLGIVALVVSAPYYIGVTVSFFCRKITHRPKPITVRESFGLPATEGRKARGR